MLGCMDHLSSMCTSVSTDPFRNITPPLPRRLAPSLMVRSPPGTSTPFFFHSFLGFFPQFSRLRPRPGVCIQPSCIPPALDIETTVKAAHSESPSPHNPQSFVTCGLIVILVFWIAPVFGCGPQPLLKAHGRSRFIGVVLVELSD